MIRDVTFQIHRDYLHGRIDIMAFTPDGYLQSGEGGAVIYVKEGDGDAATPFMSFSHRGGTQSLQSLADALAKFGVMPQVSDNAKELGATKAHLEDMRRMANRAFDLLTFNPVVTK